MGPEATAWGHFLLCSGSIIISPGEPRNKTAIFTSACQCGRHRGSFLSGAHKATGRLLWCGGMKRKRGADPLYRSNGASLGQPLGRRGREWRRRPGAVICFASPCVNAERLVSVYQEEGEALSAAAAANTLSLFVSFLKSFHQSVPEAENQAARSPAERPIIPQAYESAPQRHARHEAVWFHTHNPDRSQRPAEMQLRRGGRRTHPRSYIRFSFPTLPPPRCRCHESSFHLRSIALP